MASLARAIPGLFAVLLLAACAGGEPPQSGGDAAVPATNAATEIGATPDASPSPENSAPFDLAAAEAETARGRNALAVGDAAGAATAFTAATEAWPLYLPAWRGLAEAATANGDEKTAERARFFADRVDWAAGLHPRAAASGLRNLRDLPPLERFPDSGSPAYKASAGRMVALLESEDLEALRSREAARPKESLVQKYGVYPAFILGVGAAFYSFSP